MDVDDPIPIFTRDLDPFSLPDPNITRVICDGGTDIASRSPFVSHPREVGEVPVEFKDGIGASGQSGNASIIEDVTENARNHGPEIRGTVVLDDDDDDDKNVPNAPITHVDGHGSRGDSVHSGPSAPTIVDVPDYNNDIEEEMIRAAIEASKHDTAMSSQYDRLDTGDPTPQPVRPHLADAELARAVSLSLQTAEREKALREREGKVGDLDLEAQQSPSPQEMGKSTSSNGRQSQLKIGSSSIQDEADDIEELELARHRRRRLTSSSIDTPKDIGRVEVNPPSSPQQNDNVHHSQHSESDFPSDEIAMVIRGRGRGRRPVPLPRRAPDGASTSTSAPDGACTSTLAPDGADTSTPQTDTPCTDLSVTLGTRTRVYVEGGSFVDSSTVASVIRRTFEQHLDCAGHSWGTVPTGTWQRYYIEFQKYYWWPTEDDERVFYCWWERASARYTDMTYRMRLAGVPRPFVREEVWAAWQAAWQAADFAALSTRQRANRMSETGGPGAGPSKHTCGSRSMDDHRRALHKEGDGPPSHINLFNKTHMKKTDQGEFVYVDQRSRSVGVRFDERLSASMVDSEGTPVVPTQEDQDRIFDQTLEEVSQGHRYMYGTGKMRRPSSMYSDATSGSSTSILSSRVSKLEEQIRQRDIQHAEQMRGLEASLDERVCRLVTEMVHGTSSFVPSTSRGPHSPPSPGH